MAWKRIATILLAAIMAWAVSQEQDQNQQNQAQMQQQQQAAVRVAHLAVGAPGVQVTIDGETHFQNLSAETLSEYILVPAGEHQVEIRAAQDAQQAQDGQQDGQQDQMDVQRGEVPEEVRQSVQSALDAVQQMDGAETQQDGEGQDAQQDQQDGEQNQDQQDGDAQDAQEGEGQQDGQPANATEAVDQAVQQIGAAIENADAEALPLLEAIQASVEEARAALGNDERQVAQEALQQAMNLIEEGSRTDTEGDQQDGQQQQDGQDAIFSETVTFEAGSYYTVLATIQHSMLEMGRQTGQQAAGQDGEQAEGEDAQASDAENQDGNQGQDGQETVNPEDINVRVIQDDLSVAPAGTALVRVIHASSDAPSMNFVVAASNQQDGQQNQDQQNQDDTQEGQQTEQDQQDGQQDGQDNQDDAQEGQQDGDDAAANQDDQAGELTITIRPDHASNATVNVTGPDGFEQDTTGGQTLTGLRPGSYVIGATLQSYQQASAEATVNAGQTANVELTMQRLATAGPAPIQGQTVVAELAADSASEFARVPAGTYTAQLQATDRDLTAVELTGLDLQAGGTYTVIAYGSVADDSFAVTISVDALAPQGRDGQNGQQQGQDDAQQQDGQEDGAQNGGMQAMQDQLQQSFDDAVSAIDDQDAQAAQQALQEAQGVMTGIADQAQGAMQQTVQAAQDTLESALEALNNENFEDARAAIDQIRQNLGF